MSTGNVPASKLRLGRMSFSTKIFVGLVLGLAVGLALGELVAPLKIVADGYIRLMQMTVLPYVTISIISSLGTLSRDEAIRMGSRVGLVLLVFWGVALLFACSFALVFPRMESGSFFGTAMVEHRAPFNFVDLYIPTNPFHSLANNIVPAVVLFSIILGVALIHVEKKQALLDVLQAVNGAISRATRLIVKLTPIGLFAVAANVAGTLNLEQIKRLEIYLIAYAAIAMLMAFWILPGLVAALTPLRTREILGASRDALVTAAIAGDLFIVLPSLIETSKELLGRHHVDAQHARELPDVVVPASFNLPHSGKLLSVSFVLFAGWFSGSDLPPLEYPKLALTGLLTFFGSLNVAIPYLLDLFRVPADTYQMFLATGVINSRFGSLIAAVHTLSVGLLGSAAIAGIIQIRAARLVRYLVVTAVLAGVTLGGLRIVFNTYLKPEFRGKEIVYGMSPLFPHPAPKVVERGPAGPDLQKQPSAVLDRIRARKSLRAGFLERRLPFSFPNRNGELTGLDVEMAHRLARALGVSAEFLPIPPTEIADALDHGECDIVMSGTPIALDRAERVAYSQPYMDETLGFLVLDHLRQDYQSWESIRALGPVRIWVPNSPFFLLELRQRLPEAKLELIPDAVYSGSGFLSYDVVALPAERGAVHTLLEPKYSVVVPEPGLIRIPVAYPLPRRDPNWVSYVNAWLELERGAGTVEALKKHWIMGQSATKTARRWSLLHDVLHWVE